MWRLTKIGALLLVILGAMAANSRAQEHRAEIVAKADALFGQRYTAPPDRPLVAFDKKTETGPADRVIYRFNAKYVVLLVFAAEGSLIRIELLPEALLHSVSDVWDDNVPGEVELRRNDLKRFLDSANQLRPIGDPVMFVEPPDGCFQSGKNLYCFGIFAQASVSRFCQDYPDRVSLKEVAVGYKQSVSGIVSEIRAVPEDDEGRDLRIGKLWYRVEEDNDPRLFTAATVGSTVTLTTFGCAGTEVACHAFLETVGEFSHESSFQPH